MPPASIPAIIPLSLLEAVRTLDAPVADGLAEHPPEVARRLGMNATVSAQIGRYVRAAEKDGGVPTAEVVQVFRLVARRPDAELVFADAGRRAARYVARRNGGAGARERRPTGLARRLALRKAARAARTSFAGELSVAEGLATVRVASPLSVAAAPDGAACRYYAAAFGELLRLTIGFEGAMAHEACRGRGDAECCWRAVPGDDYE